MGECFRQTHLGLRPGEARALTVADYHDGWISVSRAVKGKSVSSPTRVAAGSFEDVVAKQSTGVAEAGEFPLAELN